MGILLSILVLPPVYVLIELAVTRVEGERIEGITFENFVRLFESPSLYVSAWNSMVFSVGSTIFSIVLGGILAWVVERTDARMRVLAYVTTVISLGTPYILYVSAWQFLLSRVGPFNQFYRWLTGESSDLFNIYSMSGMIFIEGLLWSPLTFLLMAATFRRANAEMEEAARMSGASIKQTVNRISLRLAAPAVLGLAIFVFIRNIEAFDVPVLIGMPNKINLLTTDIYLGMTDIPSDVGYASAFALVLMLLVAVLLYYYGKISKRADQFASITGKGFRPRPFRMGKWGWAASLYIFMHFLMVLLLPILAVMWVSLTPFLQKLSMRGFSHMTLEWYVNVFKYPVYMELAMNTLLISLVSATLVTIITAFSGWLAVRRWAGGQYIEQASGIPLVFPSIVLGIAMLQISLDVPIPLYGTMSLIILAFTIRYLPFGMRYSYTGAIQIHRELEEAAGVCGASQWVTLRRVVFPLMAPTLMVSWLFIFLVAAKELALAILLAGPNSKPIAVAMFDQWANGAGAEVAAMGIVWTVFMTLLTVIVLWFARRQAKTFGGDIDT
jgi:iron(III) transport system permease protein